ncbi:MAG: hypothetical protein JO095_00880 [Alphaproteobacteria bacterium]|nr:hypothetical protein [Alphaproteobacteria bacterium]
MTGYADLYLPVAHVAPADCDRATALLGGRSSQIGRFRLVFSAFGHNKWP